jgi:hypothetical protein
MKATFALLALATVAISATQAVKLNQEILSDNKQNGSTYFDIP